MYKVISILTVLFIVLALEYELVDFCAHIGPEEDEFDRILYWKQCFIAIGVGVLIFLTGKLTRK